MKVVTSSVIIENEEFVLISDQHEGRTFYGTIPCSNLDKHGRMIEGLNGAQMCISWNSPGEAIENRGRSILLGRIIKRYTDAGLDMMEAFAAMQTNSEYRKLYEH